MFLPAITDRTVLVLPESHVTLKLSRQSKLQHLFVRPWSFNQECFLSILSSSFEASSPIRH